RTFNTEERVDSLSSREISGALGTEAENHQFWKSMFKGLRKVLIRISSIHSHPLLKLTRPFTLVSPLRADCFHESPLAQLSAKPPSAPLRFAPRVCVRAPLVSQPSLRGGNTLFNTNQKHQTERSTS